MKTGLFFGSFNPVHRGHIRIAEYMASETDLEEVWLIVSPQNPLKGKEELLDDRQRLKMVEIAVKSREVKQGINLQYADIEFALAKPSYTYKTLAYLKKNFPEHEFALIMGADNLSHFNKWKNYMEIIENFKLYVYPRPLNDGGNFKSHINVKVTKAPSIDISAEHIREMIKKGEDISRLVPKGVNEYIKRMGFYK